jgi:glycosyltransferase involved in cell wall biosynthesis
MQILMFGWEFPPCISGGLGTACFGMTMALTGLGHEIVFVMPHCDHERQSGSVEFIAASRVSVPSADLEAPAAWKGLTLRAVHSTLRPYLNDRRHRTLLSGPSGSPLLHITGDYGADLIAESVRYGKTAGIIARERRFDIIHAHDWMTVFAGIEARTVSGRPLVLHIHSLEFDRSGAHIQQDIYDIERHGMETADQVIAVSQYTRRTIVERYGINPAKVSVVHNAVIKNNVMRDDSVRKDPTRKIVLFLGRITLQKGPDYFIEAAARVLKEMPEVTFVMAGDGDMMPQMIERVTALAIDGNFHFTGFLTGEEVERLYAISDLYVMPSVSEPFGITPLEAMRCNVPVMISRQSGVSEILHHVLKVDFWNVSEMADKMIAVLRRPVLAADMVARSREELQQIHWEGAAGKIETVYRSLLCPASETHRGRLG